MGHEPRQPSLRAPAALCSALTLSRGDGHWWTIGKRVLRGGGGGTAHGDACVGAAGVVNFRISAPQQRALHSRPDTACTCVSRCVRTPFGLLWTNVQPGMGQWWCLPSGHRVSLTAPSSAAAVACTSRSSPTSHSPDGSIQSVATATGSRDVLRCLTVSAAPGRVWRRARAAITERTCSQRRPQSTPVQCAHVQQCATVISVRPSA